MTDFLKTALRNAARGFRVIPLKGKDAFLRGWPMLATTDEAIIYAWANQYPDYNVGACGGSDIIILDTDRRSRLQEICGSKWEEWSNTYSVSSGRPDRAHYYYLATDEVLAWGNKKWAEPDAKGNIFEIKGRGALVVAEGSIHPDTGGTYRITQDLPLIPFPSALLTVLREYSGKSNVQRERVPQQKIGEGGRHDALVQEAGRVLRVTEMSKPVLTAHLQDFNEQWFDVPLPSNEVEQIALSCNWQPEPKPAEITVGGSREEKRVTDWRERYHTFDEMHNAPEPTFIIEGFLQKDVISSIAAPVGQRKTIIAANVVHSSITGEPLFGHFAVKERPARVLYLCPEMGLYAFAKRIRNLGLMEYVGKTLFCRTMNSAGTLKLNDLTSEELTGALVVLDTAVRFVEGDENSSEDMKVFAEDCFRIMRAGASAVMVLFHSPKGTKEVSELTLENAMRGSGDLGAFVSSCWATRLQDPDAPWESASYLKNVKQRDFESDPFEVKSDSSGRLHMLTKPGITVKLNGKPVGPRGDKDGKEAEALQVIRDNPTLSHVGISDKLRAMGIDRSPSWVGNKRAKATTIL